MPIRTHTPAEVAGLEALSGLQLLCWIDPGRGGLVPVLGRADVPAARRPHLALELNERAVANGTIVAAGDELGSVATPARAV